MSNKILNILRWIGVILLVVLIGWLSLSGHFNIGKLINKLLKKKRPTKKAVINDGKTVGKVVEIKKNKNPLRDTSIIKTTDGDEMELSKGIKDKDVAEIISVKTGYVVELKHEKNSAVFDSD